MKFNSEGSREWTLSVEVYWKISIVIIVIIMKLNVVVGESAADNLKIL